jgi:hypothetical protein
LAGVNDVAFDSDFLKLDLDLLTDYRTQAGDCFHVWRSINATDIMAQ